jgi:hypothetical protein
LKPSHSLRRKAKKKKVMIRFAVKARDVRNRNFTVPVKVRAR